MASTSPDSVLHGPHSWVDYDRSWLFRRQFLVTDYQASIMSNVVAMAMTLAGPRLWILIKRSSFAVYHSFWNRHWNKNLNEKIFAPRGQSHNIVIIDESRTELGAAMKVILNAFHRIKPRLEILDAREFETASTASNVRIRWFIDTWHQILSRPLDVLASLLLSCVLVGIFVAGSSGSVLSAGIVSDTTALFRSPRCYPPHDMDNMNFYEPSMYARGCYNRPAGTQGCNSLHNGSIAFTEIPIDRCPWRDGRCIVGPGSSEFMMNGTKNATRSVAVSFDTGLVESGIIGINAPKRYQFRRTATCAPSLTHRSPHTCSISASHLERDFFPDANPDNPVWENLVPMNTRYMSYPSRRDSPIFSAKTPGLSPLEIQTNPLARPTTRFFNNDTEHQGITCVDSKQICDSYVKKCWYLHNYESSFNLLGSRRYEGRQPNEDPALVLLEACVADSDTCSSMSSTPLGGFAGTLMEADSHCSYYTCPDLPDDQWAIEARRWFETSLARIQLNMIRILHPTTDPYNKTVEEAWKGIPDEYRAICNIGKFRSTGWRNVSVVGFLGLLSLAAGVALASCETGDGTLWIVVAARLIKRGVKVGSETLCSVIRNT